MSAIYRPRLKVCCISSPAEARLAIRYGADAVGLVGAMPSGPGPIDDDSIRAIARSVPPPVATFLLTSETTVAGIVAHHRRTCTNTIQLVDALAIGSYAELRAALPGVTLVQVIHVRDDTSVTEALKIAPQVDAMLLDSGNPDLAVKQLGGTGRIHDWQLSRHICNTVEVPVWLAGGLKPENVQTAIQVVQPFGIDVCSGLRTEGQLDEQKLAAFTQSMKVTLL